MAQPGAPGGEQGCCPTLQHRVNKALLVTHAISHERGLQTPTPAQGNIALREKQHRKEQPVLAGCESLTLADCLQGSTALQLHASHRECHTHPGVCAAQDRQG